MTATIDSPTIDIGTHRRIPRGEATQTTVVLLAVLLGGCQVALGSERETEPEDFVAVCFGPTERRDQVCEPLRIGIAEVDDSKVQDTLEQAFSDCVEAFDIADKLCDKSAASQPPCLDALESTLSCFDRPWSDIAEEDPRERDQLLRAFDECTDQAQSQVQTCFDANVEPSEASCDALEGHTLCSDILDAADDAEAQADRDHLLASYDICINYISQAYSECAVGECQSVSASDGVCQLFLDAVYRSDDKSQKDLEESFIACAKGFFEIERECVSPKSQLW